ncbi:hypothetical protein [Sandaracinus amylolyticus]|uniref:hypothetical protein n=1 Tax=Sandaracinus amylolyticus TaxID=927083 RepID=UPI001F34717E|nr:hypothetical protein [Sandaracinus amylolyticus]UJR79206.1 Hypothetical protein I5071_12390 [Sandaracinus amylolyticus]
MSPRDQAICVLLVPAMVAPLVPIVLGRMRDRTRGATRAAWMGVAWIWFFSWLLGDATVFVLWGREIALLAIGGTMVALDAVCVVLWAQLVVASAWIARRVVFDR